MKLKKLRGILFAIALIFVAAPVYADNELDVEYDGSDDIDEIIDEKNVYPGWEKEWGTITAENDSDESEVDLEVCFNIDGGETDDDFADDLYVTFYKKDHNDNSYKKEVKDSLDDLDDECVYLDRLGEKGEDDDKIKAKIHIRFDRDSGNNTMRDHAEFDMEFYVEGEEVDEDEDEVDDPYPWTYVGTGTTGTTAGDSDETEEEEEDEPEVKGDEDTTPQITSSSPTVESAKAECQIWPPKWVWVVALIIIIGCLLFNDYNNYKKREYGWKFDLAAVIIAVLFWYFFDKCRVFWWFLYGSIIAGILVHFIYIALLRKATKDENGDQGGGDGNLPPQLSSGESDSLITENDSAPAKEEASPPTEDKENKKDTTEEN